MNNNVNLNVNPFDLAQVVNGGWTESERPVYCQKSVKKFLEITGTARLQGKSATDPISIREFVKIVRRDQIDLGPQWDASDDVFKTALKDMLRQMGLIGEKRKAAHSTEEPAAKKRKGPTGEIIAPTEEESRKELQLAEILSALGPKFSTIAEVIGAYADLSGNDLLVDKIHTAVSQETDFPVDLCKMIQAYCGNYGEAEIERFIRAEFLKSPDGRTRVLPYASEKVEAFLREQKIDRTAITALDLSGIAWDVDVDYNSDPLLLESMKNEAVKNAKFRKAWDLLKKTKNEDQINVLLQKIQELAPNVKTIKMTDWVWPDLSRDTSTRYYGKVAGMAMCALGKFTELETLELSFKDLLQRPNEFSPFETSFIINVLSSLLKAELRDGKVLFSKLKTIRIIGGSLPDFIQARLKQRIPDLVIECPRQRETIIIDD